MLVIKRQACGAIGGPSGASTRRLQPARPTLQSAREQLRNTPIERRIEHSLLTVFRTRLQSAPVRYTS
ncbi:MAG: hypothetical protein KGL99_10610 [Burkholderiales bacterium]|nr:hypothetical protein [Burkholderiales bacterium]